MRWPATGSAAGVGSRRIPISTATAASRPQFLASQLRSRSGVVMGLPAGMRSAIDMALPPKTGFRDARSSFAWRAVTLRQINRSVR